MLVFNQTTLSNQNFSNQHVNLFYFNGVNQGEDVKIKSSRVSCGCTIVTCPEVIKAGEAFTVTLSIDKKNQTGIVSLSAWIVPEGQKEIYFNVSGNIKL